MKYFIALLFSWAAHSEPLELAAVSYEQPPQTASCGLLRHRELERLKVIRELNHLNKTAAKSDKGALLLANNLMVNKMFMPKETWVDLEAHVAITVKIPEAMKKEIEALGLGTVFLIVDGPGFIWQSHAYQLPNEMSVHTDPDNSLLHVRYVTYLNSLCLGKISEPKVEWIPADRTSDLMNSRVLLQKLLP